MPVSLVVGHVARIEALGVQRVRFDGPKLDTILIFARLYYKRCNDIHEPSFLL